MHTPLRVSFQGTDASPALTREIEDHVEALGRYHGHIVSCHIVVKAPDRHHRTGGHFEINAHFGLTGGMSVDVGRTPRLDERFADVHFAVADCFRRARRQLQDRLRLQRGDVKNHQPRRRRAERPKAEADQR